ncbi:MAG: ribokinase [Anaerolineaceae bacterium]|nr:MAG: ribokinase [Anaerolineaceae bacterium]
MDDGHVLVIGSAGIDVKAYPHGELHWGTPNLGRVRNSVGGVARNIAENLARLEVPTVLLTAVGQDSAGRRVLRACGRAGIKVDSVRQVADGRTGTYMALLRPDRQLHVAISDFEITDAIDPDYVRAYEPLFYEARMVVVDATLQPETLAVIFDLARTYRVKVAADPTTPALASRLCPFMDELALVVPNASETSALCGTVDAHDRDTATDSARHLVSLGVEIAVVTMGEAGLAYAHSGGSGYIRAVQSNIVDSTGAGDAFSGAAIFGLLNGVPIDEAMRLGATAASLTLQSRHTVLPNISQELLYDELMA